MPFREGDVCRCPLPDCGCEVTVTESAPRIAGASRIRPAAAGRRWRKSADSSTPVRRTRYSLPIHRNQDQTRQPQFKRKPIGGFGLSVYGSAWKTHRKVRTNDRHHPHPSGQHHPAVDSLALPSRCHYRHRGRHIRHRRRSIPSVCAPKLLWRHEWRHAVLCRHERGHEENDGRHEDADGKHAEYAWHAVDVANAIDAEHVPDAEHADAHPWAVKPQREESPRENSLPLGNT